MAPPLGGYSSTDEFQIELELRVLVFVEGGKPENPEKTLGPRERGNNKLKPHTVYDAMFGN